MEDKIYLKFDAIKGKSSIQNKGLKKVLENFTIKFLSPKLPKANPDFDHIIVKVEYWEIEYNKQENLTCREIGFDKHQNPIFAMSHNDNYGYWTDNNLTLDDYKAFSPTTIRESDFNSDWNIFLTVNQLKNLSVNGRQAYGLVCMHKAKNHYKINHEIIDELIDKLWYYVEDKSPNGTYGDWWEELNKYDPEIVNEHPETYQMNSNNPENDFENRIYKLYTGLPITFLKIIDNTIWIARCNFFGGITDYAPQSLAHTRHVLREIKLIGVQPPKLESYLKNDFKIRRGWGHYMSKSELIK